MMRARDWAHAVALVVGDCMAGVCIAGRCICIRSSLFAWLPGIGTPRAVSSRSYLLLLSTKMVS